jgi:hypothetical protein
MHFNQQTATAAVLAALAGSVWAQKALPDNEVPNIGGG